MKRLFILLTLSMFIFSCEKDCDLTTFVSSRLDNNIELGYSSNDLDAACSDANDRNRTVTFYYEGDSFETATKLYFDAYKDNELDFGWVSNGTIIRLYISGGFQRTLNCN